MAQDEKQRFSNQLNAHNAPAACAGLGAAAKRQSTADEVIELAHRIVIKSEQVNDFCNEKLARLRISHPSEKVSDDACVRDYPPLFDELRNHLLAIEYNLNRIHASVDAAEV